MFQIMRNNLGSIVLGVTFVAGLAWLLLGCGGGPENPGWGTQTDPIAASAVDDAGAGAVWAVSPCSLLPSDTYCPGSASVWGPPDAAVLVAYWCSAGFSPGPACTFVGGSGGDGGAGQWCCSTAPWCAALEPVQVSCAIDPLVACEERNGRQPASAHACGTYASTSCVGFDSGCSGVLVYCCD